ncbi:hypothetical protein MPNT_60132 [Candidatus Methylacidithermus pantelleriae]|uniref:Uncharacterized protein n=1 Tax=Candidatus Methylacidithermus pantelleriae TaxID=2744239 RepID=A0A8J2FTC9_9BACT|nr:hypothetical protein MPNT_60132 [Candidatus Methylacidithermus pantelleriae]
MWHEKKPRLALLRTELHGLPGARVMAKRSRVAGSLCLGVGGLDPREPLLPSHGIPGGKSLGLLRLRLPDGPGQPESIPGF